MNKINEIFEYYKMCKIWTSNINSIKKINNEFNEKKIQEIEDFINTIDIILESMNNDYSNLLVLYYLNNKNKEDFYYSKSTFYIKLKKASEEFMKYMGFNHVSWTK